MGALRTVEGFTGLPEKVSGVYGRILMTSSQPSGLVRVLFDARGVEAPPP